MSKNPFDRGVEDIIGGLFILAIVLSALNMLFGWGLEMHRG